MTTHVELRRGAYHDSVSLMQVSRAVGAAPGVAAAQVAMATELNVDVLRGMGFDVPAEAGPNDLVVAIRAEHTDGLDAGLAAVTDALAGLRGTGDAGGGPDRPGDLHEAHRVVVAAPAQLDVRRHAARHPVLWPSVRNWSPRRPGAQPPPGRSASRAARMPATVSAPDVWPMASTAGRARETASAAPATAASTRATTGRAA